MAISRKIRVIKPKKALRGDALSIDLGLSYTGAMEAWLKKGDPNNPVYRTFTIVDGRYLTLTAEETSDYYSGDTLIEAVEGKWYFDVEWTSTEPEAIAETIYTGTVLFFNDVTGSNGVQATPYGEVLETPYSIEIEQSNHGLVVGQAIKFDGTYYITAQGDTKAKAETIGLVRTVVDTNNFTYQFGGLFTKSTYIDGEGYFLGTDTAGAVTLEPDYAAGQYKQFIGTGIKEGLLLNIDFGEEVGEGNGTTLEQEITQTAHGFSVGDGIYFDNVDYVLAQADVVATSGIIGVVSESIDANTFKFQFGGIMTEGIWTAGVDYFLDVDTAGLITSEPTYTIGNVRVFVGQATAQGLLINIDIGQELTDQSGGVASSTLQEVTTNGNATTNNIIIDPTGNNSRIFDEQLSVIKSITGSGSEAGIFSDIEVVNDANITGNKYASVGRIEVDSSFDFGTIYGSYSYATKTASSSGNGSEIYGLLAEGRNKGTGDLNFTIGVSAIAKSTSDGVSNSTYIRGLNAKAEISSSDKSTDYLQGSHIVSTLTAGTVNNDVNVNYLDFDYTAGTVAGDLSYITTKDTSIDFSFVGGTARFIDSQVPLPSRFGGSIESTALIVTGKTNDDLLLGDGSTTSISNYVQSNTVGEPTGSDIIGNIVSLTQAEYDGGTPVATTTYLITDA